MRPLAPERVKASRMMRRGQRGADAGFISSTIPAAGAGLFLWREGEQRPRAQGQHRHGQQDEQRRDRDRPRRAGREGTTVREREKASSAPPARAPSASRRCPGRSPAPAAATSSAPLVAPTPTMPSRYPFSLAPPPSTVVVITGISTR